MYVDVDEAAVQAAYEKIHELALAEGASRAFVTRSKRYVDGYWHKYKSRIDIFTRPLGDGVFVDYGSKFGHLVPLLASQGVEKIFCLDVNGQYLKEGPRFIGRFYDVEFQKTHNCQINIASNSVDFVLANEVISHINPDYLENFYSEVARILKPGAEIAISDGNNLAHLPTRLTLIDWYERWENGPSSKELGDSRYRLQREQLIRQRFPEISDEQVRYLATNTSGLWAEGLLAAVEAYLRGEGFIERRYRPGICPTRPRSGVMMERGFFPEEVERALVLHGIDAIQLLKKQPIARPQDRGRTKNFTILGSKQAEDIPALLAFAKADHARRYGLPPSPAAGLQAGNGKTARQLAARSNGKAREFLPNAYARFAGRA